MKLSIATVVLVSVITIATARFDLSLILKGNEVSLGHYRSSTSVGNLTQKYHELEPVDVTAARNAVTVIKLFRRMFGVGILSLPPLDPFSIKILKPLTIRPNIFITGKVKLNSLTIVGAKNFQVKTFELRMKTGRVDFNVTVPNLNLNVSFNTDLYLGGLIPVAVKGQLRAHIKQLQVLGAFQTEVERLRRDSGPNMVYQMSGGSVQVRVKDVKVALAKGMNFKNILLQTINAGKNYTALSHWLTSTKHLIYKYLLNAFLSLSNNILRSVSVEQVNTFLQANDDI